MSFYTKPRSIYLSSSIKIVATKSKKNKLPRKRMREVFKFIQTCRKTFKLKKSFQLTKSRNQAYFWPKFQLMCLPKITLLKKLLR